jgi:hypothetical protein
VFNLKLNPQPITKNHSSKLDNKFFEDMAKLRCLIFIMEYKVKTPKFFLLVEEIITQSHRTLRITNSWIKYHCQTVQHTDTNKDLINAATPLPY